MADGGTSRTAMGFGLFFVVAGVAFLLDRLDVLTLGGRYLAPALLIALGIALLVPGRGRRRDQA